jgi:hypothetical protein
MKTVRFGQRPPFTGSSLQSALKMEGILYFLPHCVQVVGCERSEGTAGPKPTVEQLVVLFRVA